MCYLIETINEEKIKNHVENEYKDCLNSTDDIEVKMELMNARRVLLIFVKVLCEMNVIDVPFYKEMQKFIIDRYIYYNSLL